MNPTRDLWAPSRRHLMTGAVGVALLPLASLGARGDALSERLTAAIREAIGDAPIVTGRVTLEIPQLAENGLSVPVTITAESPMTAADHVKTIHLISERNPHKHVARFDLGPRCGRALVRTTIRLADTQTLAALAVMSDGRVFMSTQSVLVTLPACLDAG